MVITLREIIQLVDQLSPKEKDELRDYLGHSTPVFDVEKLSPEERIRLMDEAVKAIREGLSQTELDEMIEAMNHKYIEPVDDDIWRD